MIMKKNILNILKFTAFFLAFLGITCAGYFYGKQRFTFEVRKNVPEVEIINKNPRESNVSYDFTLYWDVWDKISKDYLERPVDGQKMIQGSIDALKQYVETKQASESTSTDSSQPAQPVPSIPMPVNNGGTQ